VRKAALLLAILLPAGAARPAEPLLPPTSADLVGARGLALGGYRGLPTGNDGMFTNAASLAARKRFAFELQYLLDRQGDTRAWQWFQGSVVDSETSVVTGGFAYTRVVDGLSSGSLYHLPVALPVGGGLYAGATGKLLDLHNTAGKTRIGNVDASLYWQAANSVGMGLAAYNLVPTGKKQEAPLAYGAGLHVGDGRRYNVVFDWRGDQERRGKLTNAFAAGGELLVSDMVPVRAGWLKDDTRGASWWSAGLGLVSATGVAIDLTYRQGIDHRDDRTLAVGLKLFLHSQ
jgi:hypothetical protein